MKNLLLVLCVLLISGCAQMIPAKAKELEPGKYKVTASGNVFVTIPSLIEKVDQKAIKLCGEGKYVYQDNGDFSTPHSPAYVNGVDIGGSYIVLNRVVSCK